MLNKWWKNNSIAATIITLVRVYLGYSFLTAGWGKITSGQFDASGFIGNAIKNPVVGPDGAPVFNMYTKFLENVALPNIELFNVLVPWGEFLVGVGLMLGCLTTAAAFFAMVMNFSFLLAGAISHNPTDIIMSVLIIVAGMNAGKVGLDRYVIPFIKKYKQNRNEKLHVSH